MHNKKISVNTGGEIIVQSSKANAHEQLEPVKPAFAKASPIFKKLEPKVVANEIEAKKIIEEINSI